MSDDKLIEDMADIIQATVTQALLDYDIPPEQIVCDVEMRHATVVTAQAAFDVAKAQLRDEVLEEVDDDIDIYRAIKRSRARSHGDIAKVISKHVRAMKGATNEKG